MIGRFVSSCAALSLVLGLATACEYGVDTNPEESPEATVAATDVTSHGGSMEGYMFVIHRKHNSVSRLNMRTMDVDRVKVGQRPFTMDITPDGATLVVANRGDLTVSVIDTNSMRERRIYVGLEPRNVAISPDGRYAATANFDNDSFTLIDLEEITTEPFVCLGNPTSVDFSGDGTRLFASSYYGPAMCILDLEEMETHEPVDVLPTYEEHDDQRLYHIFGAQQVVAGPADSPAENLAFIGLRDHFGGDDSELVVIDWTTERITHRLPASAPPAMMAPSADGTRLYVVTKGLHPAEPNWVAEYAISDEQDVTTRFHYPIDRDPTSILANPAMDRAYVTCRNRDKVKVLDTEGKWDYTIHTWEKPYTTALNSDGTRLFVAHDDDQHGRVTIIDTVTDKVIRVKKLF